MDSKWLIIFLAAIDLVYANLNVINIAPHLVVNDEKLGYNFLDEFRSTRNHFTFLANDGEQILIGAKNAMYNLSSSTLAVENVFYWTSSTSDTEMCLMKGKSEEECQNYIRLFVRQTKEKFVVCGTNAYKPMCRQYIQLQGEYRLENGFSGYAIIPYDFSTNFSSIYLPETDELYTGSVSDFAATDALIYRKPLSVHSNELRTQRNDFKCLNDPNFVFTYDDSEYVYFWFRENALEASTFDKIIYSRVGRVCKSDRGGLRNHLWTSFVKARLNCFLPGDAPFYFNELQSTAISGKFIYAVFSTPRSGIHASAICVYLMDQVKNVLNNGTFKIQPTVTSMWLPIMKQKLPKPKPGSCVANSKTLSDEVINFIQKNSLIHEVIPNYYSQPMFVDYNLKSQLTQLVVHKETALNGATYDILFVGTDDGRVLKLINLQPHRHSPETVVIVDIRVFYTITSVSELHLHSTRDKNKGNELIAMSQTEVKSIPTCYCLMKFTCSSCVMLQDPCCAWNSILRTCVSITTQNNSQGTLIQNVRTGHAEECYTNIYETDSYSVNEFFVQPNEEGSTASNFYASETLAITITKH